VEARGEMSVINETPSAGIKPEGGAYQVLVIDDSTFIAIQLDQILSSEGFEIADTAMDGAQGLEKYKALYPNIDLVTLDIVMPVMDGISTLEKILEFDKEARVIMISSALGKEDVVKKCLLIGARGYIVKPLDDRKKVLEQVISVLKK
jgi:two-component system chemotaxis response regulator CheY